MRWYRPFYGDKKIVTKFAFFPIKIGNETRWLEKVTIEMEYDFTGWFYTAFVND